MANTNNPAAGLGYAAAVCIGAGALGGLGKEVSTVLSGIAAVLTLLVGFWLFSVLLRACSHLPERKTVPAARQRDPWRDFVVLPAPAATAPARPLFEIVEEEETE